MFEDVDWNIDEDYLNDFNADVTPKISQNEEKEMQTLKQNTERKETLSSNTIQFEFENNVCKDLNSKADSQCNFNTIRKNAILNIFKENNDKQKDLKAYETHSPTLQFSFHNNSQASTSTSRITNECGKNLVIDVFQENAAVNVQNSNSECKTAIKSVLKITDATNENENKLKRKKNVAFSESLDNKNIAKKMCVSVINETFEKSKQNFNSVLTDQQQSISYKENVSNKSDINDNRRQALLNLLKSPVQKSVKVPRIKQTVIRKFPGPAGLLPDDINELEVIDIDSLNENKNQSNKYAEVCSQNTKNLFTTGAWQLMIDDLPANFELFDIATIKENALEYSRTYKKVPYLAGIIQYIDYKPNDPHVILKDLSGKIDARIHHSICKLYPNALGTNVVILAQDVGLIVTSKKYVCLIISPKNLISMYSDEARLIETSHLKKLLDNNCNCQLDESQISILDEEDIHENSKRHMVLANENVKKSALDTESKNETNFSKSSINFHHQNNQSVVENNVNKNSNIINAFSNHGDDLEFDEDDSWLAVNIDDLNSFNSHQFPSSTPMDMNKENLENKISNHKTLCNESPEKNNLAKTLKNYVYQKKVKSLLETSDITKKDSVINPNENLEDSSLDENLNSDLKNNSHCLITETVNSDISNCFKTSNKDHVKTEICNNSWKTKLSAFRSKHDLTPPLIEKFNEEKIIKNNLENKSTIINNKQFGCDENDTDDEMLSQLDVDAIAASYNS